MVNLWKHIDTNSIIEVEQTVFVYLRTHTHKTNRDTYTSIYVTTIKEEATNLRARRGMQKGLEGRKKEMIWLKQRTDFKSCILENFQD